MTKKTLPARFGDRIRVEIPQEPRVPAPETEGRRRGLLPSKGEDSPLLHRSRLEIIFFDLGTRLQSVPINNLDDPAAFRPRGAQDVPTSTEGFGNRYVEQEYICPLRSNSAAPSGQLFASTYHTAEDQQALDSSLLGTDDPLDPFGETPANGSSRLVSNCMPIPWDSAHKLYIDALISRKTQARYAVAIPPSRPHIPDLFHASADVATTPEWKPQNIDSHKLLSERWGFWTAAAGAVTPGHLSLKSAKHLKIESLYMYEEFDTADTSQFKITTTPNFEAEEARFWLGTGRVKVYLKPQTQFYVCHYVRHFPETSGGRPPISMTAGIVTRLPIYPVLPELVEFRQIGSVGGNGTHRTAHATRNYNAAIMTATQRTDSLITDIERVDQILRTFSGQEFDASGRTQAYATHSPAHRIHAGTLLGVIVKGQARYYVWQRVDRFRPGPFDLADETGYYLTGGVEGYMSQPSPRWATKPAYLYTGPADTAERTLNDPEDPNYQN